MPFLFSVKKTVNVLVFVLQSRWQIVILQFVCYTVPGRFEHLSEYASLITGDSYLAALSE